MPKKEVFNKNNKHVFKINKEEYDNLTTEIDGIISTILLSHEKYNEQIKDNILDETKQFIEKSFEGIDTNLYIMQDISPCCFCFINNENKTNAHIDILYSNSYRAGENLAHNFLSIILNDLKDNNIKTVTSKVEKTRTASFVVHSKIVRDLNSIICDRLKEKYSSIENSTNELVLNQTKNICKTNNVDFEDLYDILKNKDFKKYDSETIENVKNKLNKYVANFGVLSNTLKLIFSLSTISAIEVANQKETILKNLDSIKLSFPEVCEDLTTQLDDISFILTTENNYEFFLNISDNIKLPYTNPSGNYPCM